MAGGAAGGIGVWIPGVEGAVLGGTILGVINGGLTSSYYGGNAMYGMLQGALWGGATAFIGGMVSMGIGDLASSFGDKLAPYGFRANNVLANSSGIIRSSAVTVRDMFAHFTGGLSTLTNTFLGDFGGSILGSGGGLSANYFQSKINLRIKENAFINTVNFMRDLNHKPYGTQVFIEDFFIKPPLDARYGKWDGYGGFDMDVKYNGTPVHMKITFDPRIKATRAMTLRAAKGYDGNVLHYELKQFGTNTSNNVGKVETEVIQLYFYPNYRSFARKTASYIKGEIDEL